MDWIKYSWIPLGLLIGISFFLLFDNNIHADEYTCLGNSYPENIYGEPPTEGKMILNHQGYMYSGRFFSKNQLVNYCEKEKEK